VEQNCLWKGNVVGRFSRQVVLTPHRVRDFSSVNT
jgi:hypothetical protein